MITKENLLKFGFKKGKKSKSKMANYIEYIRKGERGRILHNLNDDCFDVYLVYTIIVRDVKYVHLIQNIFLDINYKVRKK